MRVTAKVKLATEKRIRASARKLFVRKGLEATSTRQIASAAKVAVGTLFNYFPSKEALAVSIAAEAFEDGRTFASQRLASDSARSLEEDLFTLVACDLRTLQPIRPFIAEVLEAALSPFAAEAISPEAADIRTQRLEDAADLLNRYGLGAAATVPVMHLYWALYLGVLSFWSADQSPNQEDTLALLDRSVRMFAAALRPTASPDAESAAAPIAGPATLSQTTFGAGIRDAAEVTP